MNHEQIEGFAALFSTAPRLTEIELRHEGTLLRLRRGAALPSHAPMSALPSTPVEAPSPLLPVFVKAEHVGVVQLTRVAVGDRIKAGQVLAQIDTMRLLSDCKASAAGVLTALLVEEGQPVEYGQPLFELTPEGK
jgi:acetyl-CoA carboxylase biotin carboxyl carrier protein